MSLTAPLAPLEEFAESWTVPEQTMWVALQAIQQTTGAQAPALLREAGLDRFLTTPLDPQSRRPVATGRELGALYHHIYTILGYGAYRLFERNCGTIIADTLLRLPEGQHLAAQAATIPPDRQVRWFAEAFGAWMAQALTPVRITEDAQACYLELAACPSCAAISGAPGPVCASSEVLFQRLLRTCLGRRVRVEEVTCTAQGAAHCTYALYHADPAESGAPGP